MHYKNYWGWLLVQRDVKRQGDQLVCGFEPRQLHHFLVPHRLFGEGLNLESLSVNLNG